ncbi:MAG TPA: alpha/beta hydrolase [Symbiobacteriaceae bacterium]|nr:alpha/beta hydrolase [Symbiobacteriaceae bacterium]
MSRENFSQWCRQEMGRCGLDWFGRHTVVGDDLLHYVEAGRGEPLLLIHGFMAWSYTWSRNVAPLAQHARVLALDLRGYGLSAKNRRLGHSLCDQAEVVRAFMDAVDISRAVVCGHSMGGEVALRLALKYPERVKALVLVASTSYIAPRNRPFQRLVLRTPLVGPAALRATVLNRTYVEKSLKFCYHAPEQFTPADVEAYYLPARTPGAAAAFARTVLDLDFSKLSDRWEQVAQPSLLVWGAEDPLVPLPMGERLARALPGSRLVVFERCGHLPHAEHAEAFNREVREFLQSL